MRGWRRWALVSPDGVAPSRMVGVSASVNLPLHHKVQKFSSGTGSPGWSSKRAVKNGCGSVVIGVNVWCLICSYGFVTFESQDDAQFVINRYV